MSTKWWWCSAWDWVGWGILELTVQDGGMGRRMGVEDGGKFPIRVVRGVVSLRSNTSYDRDTFLSGRSGIPHMTTGSPKSDFACRNPPDILPSTLHYPMPRPMLIAK